MRPTDFIPLVRLFNRWHGTRVRRSGSGHRFDAGNARMRGTLVEFEGSGCRLVCGADVRLFDCRLLLRGRSCLLEIGAGVRLRGVRIVVEDDGSVLRIGAETSMTGAVLQAKEGGRVEFGRDCMVGTAEISNSDSHSLLDSATGERLNPARDVLIGDHAWIGSGSLIMKGARIGANAVVAARSRVAGDVPGGALAAGSPAVVKRTGVTWDRRRLPAAPGRPSSS